MSIAIEILKNLLIQLRIQNLNNQLFSSLFLFISVSYIFIWALLWTPGAQNDYLAIKHGYESSGYFTYAFSALQKIFGIGIFENFPNSPSFQYYMAISFFHILIWFLFPRSLRFNLFFALSIALAYSTMSFGLVSVSISQDSLTLILQVLLTAYFFIGRVVLSLALNLFIFLYFDSGQALVWFLSIFIYSLLIRIDKRISLGLTSIFVFLNFFFYKYIQVIRDYMFNLIGNFHSHFLLINKDIEKLEFTSNYNFLALIASWFGPINGEYLLILAFASMIFFILVLQFRFVSILKDRVIDTDLLLISILIIGLLSPIHASSRYVLWTMPFFIYSIVSRKGLFCYLGVSLMALVSMIGIFSLL